MVSIITTPKFLSAGLMVTRFFCFLNFCSAKDSASVTFVLGLKISCNWSLILSFVTEMYCSTFLYPLLYVSLKEEYVVVGRNRIGLCTFSVVVGIPLFTGFGVR